MTRANKKKAWAGSGAGLCLALASVAAMSAGPAGIKLDGTLGGTAAALAGPNYNIAQSLGRLSGGDLLQFPILQCRNRRDCSVYDVEHRYRQCHQSGHGRLRLEHRWHDQAAGSIGDAVNFFLINPSGVTFTSNAVVDVPAAFYVSTANYLKFPDSNFYVDPGKMSTLSAAAPEAFGFLGSTRAPVNVLGARLTGGSNGVGDFAITAGDVTIDGGGAQNGIYESTGEIRIAAVGNATTEVPLSGPFSATDGSVTIRNGGLLWSEGVGAMPGAGVSVSAGSLLIDGEGAPNVTGVVAGDRGAPGAINVTIANDAQIVNGGLIYSANSFAGAAAKLALTAGTLTIDGANAAGTTGIESDAFGNGAGADVQVSVKSQATITRDGGIYTAAEAQGNAGDVMLTAGALSIGATEPTQNTGLLSFTTGTGNAGSIQVSADSLTMTAPPVTTGLVATILTATCPARPAQPAP